MPSSPPILLISLDATRYDYLVDNAGNWRWPFFQKFAQHAHIFRNAYTPSPWTPPAHASMFTGMTPPEHGVIEGQLWLKNQHLTLAGFLNEKHYRTIGISSNPLLGPITNLNKDFHTFYEIWKNPKRLNEDAKFLRFDDIILDSSDVIEKIIPLLDKELHRTDPSPVFLFVQLIGPHNPYKPTERSLANHVSAHSASTWETVQRYNQDWRYYYSEGRHMSDSENLLLRQLYTAELDDLNAGLEGLFSLPWFQWALENGHIIITADHGEMLSEKGHIHHLFNLYEPLINIPLLWSTPNQDKPLIHNEFIQHQHIFPLMRHLLEDEPNALSFWPDLAPEAAIASLLNPVEILQGLDAVDTKSGDPFRHHQFAIIEKERKVIWHSNNQHEYFRLADDPDESRNLFPDEAGEFDDLLNQCEMTNQQTTRIPLELNTMMSKLGYF